ncbi:hypothetical protein Tco_1282978 [Tanacetum coccineum]
MKLRKERKSNGYNECYGRREEDEEERKLYGDFESNLNRRDSFEKSNKLREEAQAENDKFLKQIDSNIKTIIKDQVKAQVSKIMPNVEKYVTESLGAEVLARSSNQPHTSYAAATSLSEFDSSKGASISQPKSSSKSAQAEEHGPRVDDLEETLHPKFNTRNDDISHNARGHQVIPFDHSINKDLEYLKGGSLIQKYTTSLTKTKAANYGHVMWIEDKRLYGYATNMETSKDVYSRHKIIVVTSLKIMEFFGYKHLEEITVRRQDDQLYSFRQGDFKRLRRLDIEDMLLLLVQGKQTNLNLDERFALNVALRMYTRRIVIQECNTP